MKRDIFDDIQLQPDPFEMPGGHTRRFTEKLDRSFHAEKRLWRIQRFALAASLAALLAISVITLNGIRNYRSSRVVMAGFTTELYETEIYLRAEIAQKMKHLASFESMNPEVMEDLHDIDRNFRKVKKEFEMNPGDERLISAILETYQTKIELLDQVIAKVEYYEN